MVDDIIFKAKQASIIIKLSDASHDWYVSNLARETATTNVHVSNFISKCENIGIVTSEKHGNIKVVRLTEKGSRIATMINDILAMIKNKS